MITHSQDQNTLTLTFHAVEQPTFEDACANCDIAYHDCTNSLCNKVLCRPQERLDGKIVCFKAIK